MRFCVAPDLRIEVNRRIHDDFHDGRLYYALAGSRLCVVPDRHDEQPSREFCEWHREHVYLG